MKRLAALALTLLLVAGVAGCGGGSGASGPPPPPPLPIQVTAILTGNNIVEAGGMVSFTAQVQNDSSNKGVTWSVSCSPAPCGTISPTMTLSGQPTTYTAPSAPPASDVSVTVTATSVADPTKSFSLTLDFAAIVVNLTASVNPVGASGTSVITATVSNDPMKKGVDPASWTISPATGAGTLSGQTSSSVTYNAPTTPPTSDTQVTITATSQSDSRQKGNVVITLAAIAVSLSANPTSLEATGTSAITATVTSDPKNAGVNPASWAITSPASGGGTLSNPTSTTVTYTAPSAPPTSNLAVTITATAASDSTKSGSTTVTVLAITITLAPTSALVPVNNGSVQFDASVQNDPTASPQVNWTLAQNGNACSPGCGKVSPTPTSTGATTTYTPPSTVPASPQVTLTAASATDTSKTTSATITLTKGTVQLVPDSLDFGSVKTTSSTALSLMLTNTGTTALTIKNITFGGTNPVEFSLTNNGCGTSVAAGKSCQLTVTFKPVNQATYNATLIITDSSADSPQQVNLTGKGVRRRGFASPAEVSSALTTNKAPNVPTPSGPSAVGTRLLDLVDATRNDPFLANGTKRELLVRMWYPAVPGQSCVRAEYTSRRVWNEFSRLLGVPPPQVTTNSCRNSAMADGVHPVVIFTHGYTGTFTDYTFLFEDLASRGYVVASVNHTFEATAVEFPDGRFAESVFGSHLGTAVRGDEQEIGFAISVRLSDLKFIVNELELLNAGADAQIAGKLDMSRVALAGHSLGGLTAILGVEEEPRFRAGIVLDGVMPKSLLREIDAPMLILAAGRDTWTDDERSLWSALRGPRLAVNLRGTEHVTPSDLVWLAMGSVKTGTMGPQKTMAAVRDYIAAFLDTNLRGRPLDPLLAGPSADYPDAAVTTQRELLLHAN